MKLFLLIGFALMLRAQNGFAQDTITKHHFTHLFEAYYSLKKALAENDSALAASKAEGFIQFANVISHRDLSEGNRDALLKDADAISETKDVKVQRQHFESLSSNMIRLERALKEPLQKEYGEQ